MQLPDASGPRLHLPDGRHELVLVHVVVLVSALVVGLLEELASDVEAFLHHIVVDVGAAGDLSAVLAAILALDLRDKR